MTSFDAGEGFEKALEEALRGRRTADCDSEGGFACAMAPPFGFSRAGGAGGKAQWGLAVSWTSEPEEAAAHPLALVGEPTEVKPNAHSIAAELGIDAAASEEQLTRRWRAFLWRNHPDRQPAHARARADARVAIANSLYDHARRRLKKAR